MALHTRREVYRRLSEDILPFVPTELPKNFSMIVYGRRRQGKTTAIQWIVYWNRFKFDDIYVFSATSFNGHYETFVPKGHIFPRFEEAALAAIIEYQKEHKGERTVLVILDDVLDDMHDIRKSDALRTAFASGRHLDLPVIVATQYPKAMNPVFRQNVDAAVVFALDNVELREMMYKSYGHMLKPPHFNRLLESHTTGHDALVAMPCANSRNPLHSFRRFAFGDKVPRFKVGRANWDDEQQ